MRYLLSSILVLLLISCASYPKKNGFTASTEQGISNPYFADNTKDYVYKANIEAFGNSFGGIFIVKKLEIDHHRIVFTTELGNKIFDFTFKRDKFEVNHILKEMDKQLLINVLKNDFQVLVKENPTVEKSFVLNDQKIFETRVSSKKYYHFLFEEKLEKIARVGKSKEKVVFLFSEINDDFANNIQILHKNFNLTIILKSI